MGTAPTQPQDSFAPTDDFFSSDYQGLEVGGLLCASAVLIAVRVFSVYKCIFLHLPRVAPLPAESGLLLHVLFPNAWVEMPHTQTAKGPAPNAQRETDD